MMAYTQNHKNLSFDFRFKIGHGMSAGASSWAAWECQFPKFENWGPQPMTPIEKVVSWIDMPKRRQCVFIRGYRVRERASLIPTVIEANSEPETIRDSPPGRDGQSGISVDEEEDIDPLTAIAQYILQV